jgi:biopolymer transport protein ExbD
MGFSKRNKVSAEFSMSSLTDIIFLLLIFFMLTSSMVQINVDLPTSDSTTVAPTDLAVIMNNAGEVTLNGNKVSLENLEKLVAYEVRHSGNKENATITIVSEVGVPWEKVNKVMAIAAGLKLKAIIATKARKN